MTNALKKALLESKTKSNIKKRSLGKLMNFEESRKIAVVYSDQFSNQSAIEKLISALKQEDKEVHLLVFCQGTKDIPTSGLHLTSRDISPGGKVRKEDVSDYLKEKYDFAICFDESNHYAINYIFSVLQASCRVGVMAPDRKNLFEMMVIANKKEADLHNEVLRYLKMIKTYEQ